MKGNLMAKGLAKPSVRPLFAQIEELIVDRVRAGEWKPGEPLPSESEFAQFYGVSQGTVRKAVAQMATDNLVVRFRGKGTFVVSQTDERAHSHFFHIHDDDGHKIHPSSRQISCSKRRATRDVERRLQVAAKEEVVVLERLRTFDGEARIFETIIVAASTFPDLCSNLRGSQPNELYPIYESLYGIRVVRAEERLKAVAAEKREAEFLGVEPGTPLLEIDRIAMTYGDAPVEWRRSRCLTADHFYLSLLH
jgi:GntR family transcriptional regulator